LSGRSEFSRLRRLRVLPVSFESMGVRSMCTLIESPDLKILVDPGVSLGSRWGLLPHPLEYLALKEARKRISDISKRADIITISHYHPDHYSPAWKQRETVWTWSGRDVAEEILRGKKVLIKDFRSKINFSQRRRGWFFNKAASRYADSIEIADGKSFTFGSTKLSFSPPVSRGEENSPLGYVLMLGVECGDERVMHCSDVQGPVSDVALDALISFKPDIAVVGGPPLYLSGFRVDERVIEYALQNAATAAREIPLVIYDHHPMRSEDALDRLIGLRRIASKNVNRIVTAAEFSGGPNRLLESKRQRLYSENPPSEAFLKWASLPKKRRRRQMPPLE